MLPLICYSSWGCKNPNHYNNLIDMGFRGWRIFVPLGMLPQQAGLSENSSANDWRIYIANYISTCPDGCWDWENHSKLWWSGETNQKLHDCLDFCKQYGWLPILNLCASDETPGWLGLIPGADKWLWLRRFCKELANYLKDVYKFSRVDLLSQ